MPSAATTTHGRATEAREAFVGRTWALASIRRALADARAGLGRVVLVSGEPGAGKTRLASELAHDARAAGVDVYVTRCADDPEATPYAPWAHVLRAWSASHEDAAVVAAMGDDGADLAHLVRELAAGMPAGAASLGPAATRHRLARALAGFVTRASRMGPLAIVLDDLHWADTPSLLVLQSLVRVLPDSPVLVLGTQRSLGADPSPPLERLLTLPGVVSVPLTELDDAAIATYLAATLDQAPTPGLVARVRRQTGGNAFLLTEVVRALRHSQWDDRQSAPVGSPAIDAVLRARVDRLPDRCRALLSAASVLGEEFPLALLATVGDEEPATAESLLDDAVRERLVHADAGRPGHMAFQHGLLRDTLYAALPADVRRGLHRRAADALATHDPLPYAALARHHLAAGTSGDPALAVAYAEQAAERALGSLAFEDAAQLYRQALAAQPLVVPPDRSRECRLLLALGHAELRSGDERAARDVFEQAITTARVLADPRPFAAAVLGRGGGWSWGVGAGRHDATLTPLLDEALARLSDGDGTLRVQLLSRLAVARYWSGATADEPAEAAIAMARRLDRASTLAGALAARHWTDAEPDGVERRLGIATELLELSARTADGEPLLLAHAMRVIDLLELGDGDAASREIDAYRRRVAELRHANVAWYGEAFRAMRATVRGDFAAAEAHLADVLRLGDEARSTHAQPTVAAQTFWLRREQGRLAEIAPMVEAAAVELARGDHLGAVAWRALHVLLLCELDRIGEARVTLELVDPRTVATLPHDTHRGITLAMLAESCAHLDDRPRAAQIHEALLPWADRTIVGPFGCVCLGPAARFLGLTAATLERWSDAERWFERADVACRTLGAQPILARTQVDRALALRRAGGAGGRAERLLAAAAEAATALGMHGLSERVRPVATPTGAAPTPLVIARTGDVWRLEYHARVVHLRDTRGVRYLAHLVARPGTHVAAVELAALAGGDPAIRAAVAARADLRAGLAAARDELADAERRHDLGRQTRARHDAEILHDALERVGRDGPATIAAERARLHVTQRIKAVVRKLRDHDEVLARHLALHVRTGRLCAYLPEPAAR